MGEFLQELVHFGVYKGSQGRITRQLTFAAIAITIALGLWRLHVGLKFSPWLAAHLPMAHYWIPGILLLAGLWAAFRLVNMPSFADFLIAVEAEMVKVSWPSRGELFRYSMVVIVVIFFLAFLLYGFDYLWQLLFRYVLRLF